MKLGTDKGYIEIELKGFAGKPNLIIRREISAKTKGSSFTLNGQPATGREVSDKMAALNVQVENLWYVLIPCPPHGIIWLNRGQFVPAAGQSLILRPYDASATPSRNTEGCW